MKKAIERAKDSKPSSKALRDFNGAIEGFDESFWSSMVEGVTLSSNKEISATLRDDTEIQV